MGGRANGWIACGRCRTQGSPSTASTPTARRARARRRPRPPCTPTIRGRPTRGSSTGRQQGPAWCVGSIYSSNGREAWEAWDVYVYRMGCHPMRGMRAGMRARADSPCALDAPPPLLPSSSRPFHSPLLRRAARIPSTPSLPPPSPPPSSLHVHALSLYVLPPFSVGLGSLIAWCSSPHSPSLPASRSDSTTRGGPARVPTGGRSGGAPWRVARGEGPPPCRPRRRPAPSHSSTTFQASGRAR